MSAPAVWFTVFATLLSCYFTATNYALLDYSRGRLLELLQVRGRMARADELAARRDDLLLMTALLRAVLNLFILVAMIGVFAPPHEPSTWGDVVLALLVTGVIIAVFGVAIPVSWSRHAAEPLLATSMPLLRVLLVVFKPLLVVMHSIDPLVRRLLGVPKPDETDRKPLEQEILDAVSEGEISGLVDEAQKEMIEAVVEFPTITVDQIMTPRTDIDGIEVSSSIEDIKRSIARTGHSRVPVYEGDLDHIVGILYVKDLIGLLGNGDHVFDLRQLVRQALFVPESKTLRDLLTQFKASKVHLAIVLDEYGGTAGLITIEDILEEIVGDIQDEYEPIEEPHAIHQVNEGVWEVHARMRIDEVNDELPVSLPEDEDYDTIGGFVFATLGRIPSAGENFDYRHLRFTITDAEKTRVNRVRIETFADDKVTESAEARD